MSAGKVICTQVKKEMQGSLGWMQLDRALCIPGLRLKLALQILALPLWGWDNGKVTQETGATDLSLIQRATPIPQEQETGLGPVSSLQGNATQAHIPPPVPLCLTPLTALV